MEQATIELETELFEQAQRFAREYNREVEEVIRDALVSYLTNEFHGKAKGSVSLETFKGSGLQPGVNLDSNASVREVMDS